MAKVLVVDDDPATRRIFEKALRSLGVDCHFCSDGVHALDALQCNRDFDVLFADISMPVMDGRHLIEIIRRDRRLPVIPIIVMSGVVGAREISDLVERGAAMFLPKPMKVEDIREVVGRCLESASPAG